VPSHRRGHGVISRDVDVQGAVVRVVLVATDESGRERGGRGGNAGAPKLEDLSVRQADKMRRTKGGRSRDQEKDRSQSPW